MEIFLPVEIITDILSRLLTESLFECSLVCKTWRNLIYNDKLFAHMHSRRIYDHDSVAAVSSGKASFVYLFKEVEPKLKYMEYGDDDHEKSLKFGITNLIPALDYYPFKIIGSCNGLICISGFSKKSKKGDSTICICNPITREFVYLSKLPKKSSLGYYVVSGFGYHALTNEYKVVRICYHATLKEKTFVGRVYVYTLGSVNGWRNLEDITYRLHPSVSNEILVNGALHWLDKDGDIVKFDLSDETFCVIEGPECIDYGWDSHMKNPRLEILLDFELRVLGGCLRIIQRHSSRWYNICSFKKSDDRLELLDNENDGKIDADEEHYESSWSWEEDALEWGAVYDDMGAREVYPFTILKDNAKILYHDDKRYYDDKCYYYRQNLGEYFYRQDRAENEYDTIANRLPCDSVRYVKSFVSLKALGEEAKIMEPSETEQELTNSSPKWDPLSLLGRRHV